MLAVKDLKPIERELGFKRLGYKRTDKKPIVHILDERGGLLRAPARFSLTLSPIEVLAFIERLCNVLETLHEEGFERGCYYTFDMTNVKILHVDAALLLAAVLDNWHDEHNFHFHRHRQWDKSVIRDFNLLKVDAVRDFTNLRLAVDDFGKKVLVPVFTGTSLRTNFIESIQRRIKRHVPGERSEDFRHAFYKGMVEGVNNVIHHARRDDPNRDSRWWGVAAIWQQDKRFIVGLYDDGHGVSATLNRSSLTPALTSKFGDLADLSTGELVREAMIASQQWLGVGGRGHGLREIQGIVDCVRGSRLKVWSNDSLVTYKRKDDYDIKVLDAPVKGTLLLWDVGF